MFLLSRQVHVFGVWEDTGDPELTFIHWHKEGAGQVRSLSCLGSSRAQYIGYPSLSPLLSFSSPSLVIFSFGFVVFGLLSHDPQALAFFFDCYQVVFRCSSDIIDVLSPGSTVYLTLIKKSFPKEDFLLFVLIYLFLLLVFDVKLVLFAFFVLQSLLQVFDILFSQCSLKTLIFNLQFIFFPY